MRIAYGVFGYGRGHATRTAAVLPALCAQHEVKLFAGGDAYDSLSPHYEVERIPTLGYAYDERGRPSAFRTLRNNLGLSLDILVRGRVFRRVRDAMSAFGPDVVISDAEPLTHRVAHHLGVPRIGFDHFGVMVYCKPEIPFGDRIRSRRDVLIYRMMMGQPQRVIVSSFYRAAARRAGVRVIGTLLRDEVFEVPPRRGDHLLVYLNQGKHQFTGSIEEALRGTKLPIRIYGTSRDGVDENLRFCRLSNRAFLEDLAGCRALICTAGNQLVGEAMYYEKPMLVMPEKCVEQRLNASNVERLGIGWQAAQEDVRSTTILAMLRHEKSFVSNIRRVARDGRRDALETLESFILELTGTTAVGATEEAVQVG